jgi:hypothetical protein
MTNSFVRGMVLFGAAAVCSAAPFTNGSFESPGGSSIFFLAPGSTQVTGWVHGGNSASVGEFYTHQSDFGIAPQQGSLCLPKTPSHNESRTWRAPCDIVTAGSNGERHHNSSFRTQRGSIGQGRMSIRLILFGEASLKRALAAFIAHHHSERPHQGKENLLLFPLPCGRGRRQIVRRERLGGLLKYYARAA